MNERPLILSVENEIDNQILMVNVLESFGYFCITAADGVTALKLAQETLPDLILLDIALPGMDGMEVVRQLKADSKTSKIPVVAVTALATPRDQARILAAGCDGFLGKPHTLDAIEELLTFFLDPIRSN